MKLTPLVSVVIPVYNTEKFIARAMESALAQTHANLEVIVVDDGSSDNTVAIVEAIAVRDARVKLLRQPNGGVAKARNLGITCSQGEFIAPLDADDVWMPHKIERQVECMERGGADVGMVYCWWMSIDEDDRLLVAGAPWDIEGHVLESLIYCNFVGNASVPLFRRCCLDHIGYYNVNLKLQNAQGCEDWELTLRVAEHYQVKYVASYESCYRNVSGSMAKNVEAMINSHLWVIAELRARHPQIKPSVWRWSHSFLLRWMMENSYQNGDYKVALQLQGKLLRCDPFVLWCFGVRRTLKRSLLGLVIGKSVMNQLQRRRRGRAPDRKESLSEAAKRLQQHKGRYPFVWRPAFSRPYDLMCVRRWRQLAASAHLAPATGKSSTE